MTENNMTTIYLIRHAEAEGNLYRRIHGHYDALITENGYAQIRALEKRFADVHIDAVYSSDLYRTMTTARAVYVPKGLELHTDARLREIDMGAWEDKSWGEMYRNDAENMKYFGQVAPDWRVPGGETFGEVGARMLAVLDELVQRHSGQTVAVFSHGTIIRQATLLIDGVPAGQWHTRRHSDNTAVTRLDWDGARFHIVLEGDNAHLDPSISTLARQNWWRTEKAVRRDLNYWYRPLDWPAEEQAYLDACCAAQESCPDAPFDAQQALREIDARVRAGEVRVYAAMLGEQREGLLALAEAPNALGRGELTFFAVSPELRRSGLGAQLIGQAISHFRPQGCEYLRAVCPAANTDAVDFLKRYGFYENGELAQIFGGEPAVVLEKYIGYDYETGRRHLAAGE